MTISEKVAYLKGLAEGFGIDAGEKEGKLFSVIIDILEDMAMDIEDLEANSLDLAEEIDELSDDLADVEELIFGDDDEDDDDRCCDDDCCCNDDTVFFEVTCPACENTITVDDDVLTLGAIECPNCGESLEFDLDSLEGDDDNGDDD